MAKAYYHHLPTVLCKILGVYTIRFDNRETGRKAIENVVVMENIFYQVRPRCRVLSVVVDSVPVFVLRGCWR